MKILRQKIVKKPFILCIAKPENEHYVFSFQGVCSEKEAKTLSENLQKFIDMVVA